MVGFSQGAAFSYAFALDNPQRVDRLASLAGFLPSEADHLAPLSSIPIFVAHGTEDETVPVCMARSARSSLEAAGVKVTYCESETGHKLGANCAKQLRKFFESVS
jgi:phospholipase/carboxylesterase